MTPDVQTHRVRRRMIECAAPHLIDAVCAGIGGKVVADIIGRRVIAHALATCHGDVQLVVTLRWQWLELHTLDNWLTYVRKQMEART